jgi:hypothetical protein
MFVIQEVVTSAWNFPLIGAAQRIGEKGARQNPSLSIVSQVLVVDGL